MKNTIIFILFWAALWGLPTMALVKIDKVEKRMDAIETVTPFVLNRCKEIK